MAKFKAQQLHGKCVWRISQRAPMGEWVDLSRNAEITGTPAAELANDSLKALQRFPGEIDLTVLPALRLRPDWGGSPAQFEEFASRVMKSQGNQPSGRTRSSTCSW